MSRVIKEIKEVLLNLFKELKKNKLSPSFWIWIALFMILYKKHIFLIAIVWVLIKIIYMFVKKEKTIYFKITDILILNYLHGINKNKQRKNNQNYNNDFNKLNTQH